MSTKKTCKYYPASTVMCKNAIYRIAGKFRMTV